MQALATTPPTPPLLTDLNSGRSPMAEGVFRSLTTSSPNISHIDSAGTIAYHAGNPPDPRTMSTLEANGITNYEHQARQVRGTDFRDFDYILAMDGDNLRDLRSARQRYLAKSNTREGDEGLGKVMLFGDFGGRKGEEVVDPYYGARDGFEIAYEQMVRFSKGLLDEIVGRQSR
ncbi:hypothetical protein MMC16_002005 [Acarospora aff. strigata]|nr:hypothetical protein [Acarospora aff. strigata]